MKICRHFLWRAFSYSNLFQLVQMKLLKSPIFSLCDDFEESVEHCLLLCPWTDCVWFGSIMWLKIPKQAIPTLDDWILHLSKMTFPTCVSKKKVLSLFACFIWCIWKTRCHSIFKSTCLSPADTIQAARTEDIQLFLNLLLNSMKMVRWGILLLFPQNGKQIELQIRPPNFPNWSCAQMFGSTDPQPLLFLYWQMVSPLPTLTFVSYRLLWHQACSWTPGVCSSGWSLIAFHVLLFFSLCSVFPPL